MVGKLYIKTHGCQMNEYDSAKMADVLKASHGLTITDKPEEADVLLLNTCSIREKAQEKVFSELGRWRALTTSPSPDQAARTRSSASISACSRAGSMTNNRCGAVTAHRPGAPQSERPPGRR